MDTLHEDLNFKVQWHNIWGSTLKIQVAGSTMKLCGITIQKTVTFVTYFPWQCSSVGSLTPECEETDLSVFLLLTGSCDHTSIESVQALCFSHNTGIHKSNHSSYTLQIWVKSTVQESMAWTYHWFWKILQHHRC